ncbi:MAG: DUF2834 domain-containing protein [Candidatus Manganitrophaceae bacterium]
MKLRHFYLLLCVVGTVLPCSQFLPWLAANGFDPALFFRELFSTRIGAFFGMDLFVSALVLFTFVFVEGRRLRMRYLWAPVLSTLAVGVSLGLPLFLYMRQVHVERSP